ncbi:hypothetical protein M8C21_020639 [Ambrosia artemisiifolia]|uniref:Large ribosomal subunit protein uL4 C-terminal domain-containing protein n=1 Tax=Ambrosia artemisiifolia TaxID=4212 RepID=A0AAD5BZH5_AMBAR|nr:hypothetical protein M8C21_020639 [Ambrosia artemisiifolia]
MRVVLLRRSVGFGMLTPLEGHHNVLSGIALPDGLPLAWEYNVATNCFEPADEFYVDGNPHLLDISRMVIITKPSLADLSGISDSRLECFVRFQSQQLVKAFRNMPGVEIANVERLNLLKLAPGGHVGRFSVVKPIKKEVKRASMKKNPLKNLNTMLRLNPYAKTAKRMAVLAEEQRKKAKKEKFDSKRNPISKEESAKIKSASKSWYKTMISDSDYAEFDVFTKWLGVS